jgi:dihydrolipoamide dehydrogenase
MDVENAVNNVFSSKKSKKIHVNYSLIPYTFSTYPNFARIGLTEIRARQKLENNIQIIKAYFKSQNQTQFLDTKMGICKLIINSKQEILGVHILGNQAAELITLFTIVIQQKIKLDQLVKINSPSPLFSEILQQLI